MNLRTLFYLVAIGVTLLSGCSSDGCLNNQSALPLAAFYSSASGNTVSVSGVEIRGVGAPGDSVLVKPTQRISTVYLPMRSDRQSTEWEFTFTVSEVLAISDNITFDYTSIPYFASEECGAMYYYHIDRVGYTTSVIDSVVVTDSLITNYDMTRIRIYLREQEQPAPEEPEE